MIAVSPPGRQLALPVSTCRSALPGFSTYSRAARTVGETQLVEGESLLLDDEPHVVEAHADTDLVLFTTDERAPVFTGGMFSGNTLTA